MKVKPIHENDEELVARVLITISWLPCQSNEVVCDPMSLHVSRVFGIDKEQAEALCRRFQYDPDMRVRKVMRR